jgi:hypothetical protein
MKTTTDAPVSLRRELGPVWIYLDVLPGAASVLIRMASRRVDFF